MSYRVSDYTEGCENHILPLFNTAFKRELPREQWEWRFKKNPYGGPFIACIWDDSRLGGILPSLLCRLITRGRGLWPDTAAPVWDIPGM